MPKPKKVFRGSSLENETPLGMPKKSTPNAETSDIIGSRQQRTIFSGSGNVYAA
jgi:hypothetical protein